MGLKNDGTITAVSFKMISDGGAYGMSTEGVMRKAAILSLGPYDIANVQIDTYGIYTNNTPSGAFRTFGAMQAQFATESHLDICAERLGLDPFEIRRRNMMKAGSLTHTGQRLETVSIAEVLETAEAFCRWESGAPTSRGATRGDLGGPDTRRSCTLGARIKAETAGSRQEVA
jgi:CO/xanthine dehydrogenase Mo-binding subunit